MRTTAAAVLVIATLLGAGCGPGDEPGAEGDGAEPAAVLPDSVRGDLVRMGVEDQAIRAELTAGRLQDTAFVRRMLAGDSARSLRLREIVHRWGWPDTVKAGPEAAAGAFLVLQHSPLHGFQEAVLPMLEASVRRDAMAAADVALLVDRVLVRQGRPQRYGTQFDLRDGRLVAEPVEDLERLAGRRRAMGLPPMDEYIRLLEESYDAPVVGPGERGPAPDSLRPAGR
ncbi:MAG: DUF6624 domain-containing protein [Longimicrobiales bacterium]|nr:DUF6624 domain-containing protein [Longimicrobiales bacterium]